MIEWFETNLNDVIEITGGGTPKTTISEYWFGDIPWLSVVDFNTGRKYVNHTEKSITEVGLNNSSTKILQKGDIIISARGTVGAIAVLKKPMAFNQSCYGLRGISNIADTDFIYYLTNHSINQLQQIAHGGVFDTITKDTFKSIDILLPSLPEQKAIASVLSSLDDKIDLLHRQNKTLEAMAETLFRQWFVEGKNKKTYYFGELVETVSVKHSFPSDMVVFLNTSDIYNGKVLNHKITDVLSLPGQAKKSIRKGDILFTEIRPANRRFAYIDFDANNYVVSTKLMVLRSRGILNQSLLFLYLKMQDNLDYLQMLAEGRSGTFPQITFDEFKTLTISVPQNQLFLDNLTETFSLIHSKMIANYSQINIIERFRDTLLPKFMSGEVKLRINLLWLVSNQQTS